jgi:hypothetical protein
VVPSARISVKYRILVDVFCFSPFVAATSLLPSVPLAASNRITARENPQTMPNENYRLFYFDVE